MILISACFSQESWRLRLWLGNPRLNLASIRMFEAQRARVAGIQLHVSLKRQGALAGDRLAFNLYDLVPRPYAGCFRY
jgi:hypothetical protein